MNTSRRRRVRRGFTLIEAIVIIVILGVIAAVIAPRLINRIGQSRTAVAESNAQSLATAMKLFGSDCGLPREGDTIDILWEKPSWAATRGPTSTMRTTCSTRGATSTCSSSPDRGTPTSTSSPTAPTGDRAARTRTRT